MGRLTQVQKRDEFQVLLNTLAGDLGRVNDRVTLYRKLTRARKSSHSKAFINAPTFWSLVLGTLQDAALQGLARAYDQRENNDVITLKTALDTIHSQPRFLLDGITLDYNQLKADLRSVSHRTNSSVKQPYAVAEQSVRTPERQQDTQWPHFGQRAPAEVEGNRDAVGNWVGHRQPI